MTPFKRQSGGMDEGEDMRIAALFMGALAAGSFAAARADTPSDEGKAYRQRIDRWRKDQAASLKAEGGWLTVAGLYWLKEGRNTIGTGASNALVLPAGSAPPSVGVVTLLNGMVSLQVANGVNATVKGKPITSLTLHSDRDGVPDRVVIGALTLTVIQRGARIGIRFFNANARGVKEFKGLKWYPVDPAYRVEARFVPYSPPKTVPIVNVLGDTVNTESPGYVVFTLGGKECRLDAQSAGSGLFFNFRDLTSGKTTYPAGRFLDAQGPKDGVVVLDFNQAVNPPCAFTAFATCPLPPRQNYLSVGIPSGEKTHHAEK